MTATTDPPTRPVHEAACGRRIRERMLGRSGATDAEIGAVPPTLLDAIAVQIAEHCGHRPLKCRRLASGWTVAQAVSELHGLVSAQQLRPVGGTERSWKDWEAGVLPVSETQDLLCRLFATSPMALGFAYDYSPATPTAEALSGPAPDQQGLIAGIAGSGTFEPRQSSLLAIGHEQVPLGYRMPQSRRFPTLEELPDRRRQFAAVPASSEPQADTVASVVRLVLQPHLA